VATFVQARDGAWLNAAHIAVVAPAEEAGHCICLASNGDVLGTVTAAEVAELIGHAPDQPEVEPELFVIGRRS
jgi:hypothetical protein